LEKERRKKMKKSKKRERVVVESLSDLATAAFKKSLENRMVRQIEIKGQVKL
jgi:SET domain-containing protein